MFTADYSSSSGGAADPESSYAPPEGGYNGQEPSLCNSEAPGGDSLMILNQQATSGYPEAISLPVFQAPWNQRPPLRISFHLEGVREEVSDEEYDSDSLCTPEAGPLWLKRRAQSEGQQQPYPPANGRGAVHGELPSLVPKTATQPPTAGSSRASPRRPRGGWRHSPAPPPTDSRSTGGRRWTALASEDDDGAKQPKWGLVRFFSALARTMSRLGGGQSGPAPPSTHQILPVASTAARTHPPAYRSSGRGGEEPRSRGNEPSTESSLTGPVPREVHPPTAGRPRAYSRPTPARRTTALPNAATTATAGDPTNMWRSDPQHQIIQTPGDPCDLMYCVQPYHPAYATAPGSYPYPPPFFPNWSHPPVPYTPYGYSMPYDFPYPTNASITPDTANAASTNIPPLPPMEPYPRWNGAVKMETGAQCGSVGPHVWSYGYNRSMQLATPGNPSVPWWDPNACGWPCGNQSSGVGEHVGGY